MLTDICDALRGAKIASATTTATGGIRLVLKHGRRRRVIELEAQHGDALIAFNINFIPTRVVVEKREDLCAS